MSLMSFQIGEKVSIEELELTFGDKLTLLSPTKIFIQDFIDFQYGELNPENRVHKSVLNRVEKEGAKKGLKRPLQGTKDKDKEKDKDKDKVKDKEIKKEKFKFFAKKYRDTFPGTTTGPAEERFLEQIKTEKDEQELDLAMIHYSQVLAVQKWRSAKTAFATFLGTAKGKDGYFWRGFIEKPNLPEIENEAQDLSDIFGEQND